MFFNYQSQSAVTKGQLVTELISTLYASQALLSYGDPAYPLRLHLRAPFRHGVLTPTMEQYNLDMSSIKVTVEWLFGDIINDFKFLDFKKLLFATSIIMISIVLGQQNYNSSIFK